MVSCGSGVSWGSNGEVAPHSLSEVAAVSGGWGDPWTTARTRRETLRCDGSIGYVISCKLVTEMEQTDREEVE